MPAQNKVNAIQRAQQRAERGPFLTADGNLASKIAARVMLEDEEKEGDITPDLKTVGVLFSFATKTNQVGEVRSRVKQYLPDVWYKVPSRHKNLWTSLENSPDATGPI